MAMLLGKRASIIGTTLRNRSDDYKADLIRDFTTVCLPAFENKELKSISLGDEKKTIINL